MRTSLALLLLVATAAVGAEPGVDAVVDKPARSLAITDLSVGEGIEREAFLKAVHTRWDALEACYDAALAEHPTLGGQWNATLTLVKKKGVQGVKQNYASVNLDSLEACLGQALGGLMFEDKKAAGELTLSLTADPGPLPLSAYEAASRYAGGTAKLGDITAQGGVDVGAVTNVATERLPFLRGCYSEALRRRELGKGMVVLKVNTASGGVIEEVDIIRSGLRDDTAERCMVALARELDLGLAEDALPGVAVIPVVFAPVE